LRSPSEWSPRTNWSDPPRWSRATFPHAGHDPQAGRDVSAVGQLDAHPAVGGARRSHQVRDDVEGATPHRPPEQRGQLVDRLPGGHPVVGGPGVVLLLRADEGQVFRPGHVGGMAPVEVGTGILLGIELQEGAVLDHPGDEGAVLLLGSVAPVNPVRLGEPGAFIDPVGHGRVQRRGGHRGVIA
jgi:hypothetical protein